MRTLKFRAWDGKRMHTWNGDLLGDEFTVSQMFKPDIPTWDLMQWTGLITKYSLKDGSHACQEVYEADIVEWGYETFMRCIVGWDHCGFVLHEVGGNSYHRMPDHRSIRVIGNIYEHPFLLSASQGEK